MLPNTARTPAKNAGAEPARPSEEHRDRGGGSLRVFEQFRWLEVGSVKVAFSGPAHQRVPRRKHAGQAASR